MTDRTTAAGQEAWFHPRASLASDGWELVVDASLDGWQHTGLRTADLASRDLELPAGEVERLIVPLEGGCLVQAITEDGAAHEVELEGRASVFDGPTDCLYLPPGASATLSGSATGPRRVAVAEAPATTRHPLRRIGRDEVPVELRGRGRASRQVHDLGTPSVLDAERLIVCEVITPAGNWSSYPPHKHDEELPGRESQLEEIYYFELAPAPGAPAVAAGAEADPYALFAAASSSTTEIELDVRVRSGDVALLPGGFHGPAVAPPTHDLYYLNVMAGPGDRVWRITDEPAHEWVREAWLHEPADDRLPYIRTTKGARP
ncbi:5-deoxy-glucuronate isomerase [Agromyces sp. CCNWLW203]|uniref:5-deoxy-glucuronate isomerase n=1 Tax=Agromyces sp. CCNWLW203 TaxID=3112842 RepID=UPI002F962DDB